MRSFPFSTAWRATPLVLIIACGPDAGVNDPDARARFTEPAAFSPRDAEWSTPENLGPVVNSASVDLAPTMSKDGLSLYFASNRPGGKGSIDLYVSQRESIDAPWGAPVNLDVINSAFGDAGAQLSRDGHWLFFTSARLGGRGGYDLYRSWRADIHDDFAWGPPENLGTPVNSTNGEFGPSVWGPELYFFRGPSPTIGGGDIYMSRMTGNSFGVPEPLAALNSASHDEKPGIRFDGREIVFASDRVGSMELPNRTPSLDLWYSTRSGNGQQWSPPQPIPTVNGSSNDRRPTLSADGTMLFFDSDRPGGSGSYDLYVSRRVGSR